MLGNFLELNSTGLYQGKLLSCDLKLETEGIILHAFMSGVTSLWPQKVVFGSQIYSARAKLKLISDQARA